MSKKYGAYSFDPIEMTGIAIPKKRRAEALEEVAEFVKEQVLSRTGEGRTSVKGGKFVKKLSPEYAKKKLEETNVDFANLELYGDMLDSMDSGVKGKKVFLEVAPEERGKAEGHITGIYGNNATNKKRQFMPVEGEEFAPEIMNGVKRILRRYEEDEE